MGTSFNEELTLWKGRINQSIEAPTSATIWHFTVLEVVGYDAGSRERRAMLLLFRPGCAGCTRVSYCILPGDGLP